MTIRAMNALLALIAVLLLSCLSACGGGGTTTPPPGGGNNNGGGGGNNGGGLTKENQRDVFTEFTRLDETGVQGHGLGLATVRRIIEKLDGDVGVDSAPGQGSTFYFTLPSA